MAANVEEEPDLPKDVVKSLQAFHESLTSAEDVLKPFLDVPVNDLYEKLEPVERAKADLVVAYSINSLFWMYLVTQGVNPKDHPVKLELERIRKYMGKLKEVTGKKKAGKRIDKAASQRFVKSALWQPGEINKKDNTEEKSVEKQKGSETTHKAHKRKKSKH